MKKKIFLSAWILLTVISVFAQAPNKPKAKTLPSEDTIQYSLGVYMMQQLFAKTGFVVTDPVMFKKAIDDVSGGKKLMVDPATTEARLLAYQKTYQLAKGQKLEELLFAGMKGKPGFTVLPSGVMYAVPTAGKGIQPSAKDTVILNVVITLPDGTIVEDFTKTNQSYQTLVSDLVPGLKEVLVKMQEGTIFKAILPAATAYGTAGTVNIPPNSAVIYEVALVNVRKAR